MRADAPALSELIFGRKQGLDCLIGHPKSYRFASKKTGARVRFERARPKYVVCRQDQRAGPAPSPLRLKEWLTRSGISGACSVPARAARQAPDRPNGDRMVPAHAARDRRRALCEWNLARSLAASRRPDLRPRADRGPRGPRGPVRPARRPLDRTATEWCLRARPSAGCKARCKWPPTSDLAQAARVARTARAAPRLPCGWSLVRSRAVQTSLRPRAGREDRRCAGPARGPLPGCPADGRRGRGSQSVWGGARGLLTLSARLSVVQSAPGGARRVGARSCEAVPITCS
jgi:hypothetical protein